ncbi:hypothetical protein PR048_009798 [Dryococelus australis]|uniref:Uncharacterized protein n=1 Tax=Dryococelus australis TaxID=614101 RepID=A0ABQ9I1Z9_9NEOP|nr:hypothetical protein PR048_009798 [Dryococelus australis]
MPPGARDSTNTLLAPSSTFRLLTTQHGSLATLAGQHGKNSSSRKMLTLRQGLGTAMQWTQGARPPSWMAPLLGNIVGQYTGGHLVWQYASGHLVSIFPLLHSSPMASILDPIFEGFLEPSLIHTLAARVCSQPSLIPTLAARVKFHWWRLGVLAAILSPVRSNVVERGRKRAPNPEEWARKRETKKRLTGHAYINRSGKCIEDKLFHNVICGCALKCNGKISITLQIIYLIPSIQFLTKFTCHCNQSMTSSQQLENTSNVEIHIRLFPAYTSHYTIAHNPNRKNFDSDLTI